MHTSTSVNYHPQALLKCCGIQNILLKYTIQNNLKQVVAYCRIVTRYAALQTCSVYLKQHIDMVVCPHVQYMTEGQTDRMGAMCNAALYGRVT